MSKKKSKSKMPDWMVRDEDYVYRGGERSGWDSKSKSTSDYLYGDMVPRSPEKQIKEIYQICRNRGRNLSDKPVHISFSHKEETGRTDGKKVLISTGVLDTPKTFNEKADIMMGIVTHEMAHILHTDFKAVKKEIKNSFEHSVWNVLEDERIEKLIGEEFPGYANNLGVIKDYFFDEKYLLDKALEAGKKPIIPGAPEKEEEEDEDEDDEWTKVPTMPAGPGGPMLSEEERKGMELFDLLLKFVRYPKHISDELVGKYETEIDEIKSILTPYPASAKDAIDCSKKVATVIKKSLEEDMSSSKASSIMDELSKMTADLDSDNEENEEGKDPRDMSESVMKYDYEDVHIEDPDYRAVFRKGIPDRSRYEAYLREVNGDAKRLANVLLTRTFNETKTLKGMRSGTMDDNRIVEAAHGVRTVHLKKIEKVGKEVNMAILIDESGSMSGRSAQDAAKVAVLLEKAYDIFPVGQLFIYGFTSDNYEDYNTIIRYREPGLNIKYGLGDVRGRCNNRDGHCIRAVAKRVRTFTQRPMLYFIISDGQPAALGYSGYDDTRKAVTEVTKMKFFPVQIGIGEGLSPSEQARMFDEFVHYDTSRQMVEQIRRLLVKTAHKHMGL